MLAAHLLGVLMLRGSLPGLSVSAAVCALASEQRLLCEHLDSVLFVGFGVFGGLGQGNYLSNDDEVHKQGVKQKSQTVKVMVEEGR